MNKYNLFNKKTSGFSNWIISKFQTFHWKYWFCYCLCIFVVGQVINVLSGFSFSNFGLHQILLVMATTMLVAAMKSFFKDVKLFDQRATTGLLMRNTEISSLYKNKFLPLQRSPIIMLVSVLIASFFFICIVLLEYICIDSVGLYAIYVAGSSVLIGVYGYSQYVIFLWFIYRIGKCEQINYDLYTPAESPWIIQLTKTSQRLRNYFLAIGLIYVIEYSILIPTDKITFTDKIITMDTPNNVAFIVSWIALFLLVIVAFPVINHIQRMLVLRIIERLKGRTVTELSELMHIEHAKYKDKSERLSTVVTYSILIENVKQSKRYPIKRLLSYETIMVLITFTVHIFNLIDKISLIPQLKLLL